MSAASKQQLLRRYCVLTFSGLGKNGKLFDATMLIVLELLTAPASGAAMKAVAEPARASTHAADCITTIRKPKQSIFSAQFAQNLHDFKRILLRRCCRAYLHHASLYRVINNEMRKDARVLNL
jgi:hypothetical protein